MTQIRLEDLRLLRGGRIFRVTRDDGLRREDINGILGAVVDKAGTQVGRRVLRQEVVDGQSELGRISIVAFKSEARPAFVIPTTALIDVRHGCCVLFERDEFVLVATMQLTWSERLSSKTFARLSRGEMQFYAANDSEAHESATLRSLDIADASFRAQHVEGVDLSATYPSLGANRTLLTAVGVRKSTTDSTTVTLSSASVRTRGARVGYLDWCRWARIVIDDVRQAISNQSTSAFVSMFATPLDLKDLPPSVRPTGLLLWLESVSTEIDSGHLQFWWEPRNPKAPTRRISAARVDRFMNLVRTSMAVRPTDHPERFRVEAPTPLGPTELTAKVKSFSLRTPWSARVRVHDHRSDNRLPLSTWLRENGCVHLVFSDIEYAYTDNTLFRDSRIDGQVARLANILKAKNAYRESTPEKLKTPAGQRFAKKSLFGQLEAHFSAADVLVCDDEAGEWADYIAIEDLSGTPSLTFVHAKAGSGVIAPAAFEVVVSQAIKNLSRRFLTAEMLKERRSRWIGTVGTTSITRIRRGGTLPKVERALLDVMARPDARARVVLAVTFLSRGAVLDVVNRVAAGKELTERQTQLAWLLTSFMSSCQRAGVVPEVWCRP